MLSRDWKLNFNLGSALKYIARAGRKGRSSEDLEKARGSIWLLRLRLLKAESGKSEGGRGKVYFNPLFEEKVIDGVRLWSY